MKIACLESYWKSHSECIPFWRLPTRCVSVQSLYIKWNKFVREFFSTIVYKCCLTGCSCHWRNLHSLIKQLLRALSKGSIARLLEKIMKNFLRQNCSTRKLFKYIFFKGISSEYMKGIIFKLIFLRTSCFFIVLSIFQCYFFVIIKKLDHNTTFQRKNCTYVIPIANGKPFDAACASNI